MQHTNEKLAVMIQRGQVGYLSILWEQVQAFVRQQAARWLNAWRESRPTLDFEDLYQDGYLALCEAVQDYDPDKGAFLTWYGLRLKTAFSEEVGCRTPAQLRRPENSAISLEMPTVDGEDITLGDAIAGPDAYQETEEQLYREQVNAVVREAVEALPARQRDVVRLRYLEGLTLRETGQKIGVAAENVRRNENKAFRTLRKNPAILEVHHGDRNLYRGTSLGSYRRTGCSVQELEVIRKEEVELRARLRQCKTQEDRIAYYVECLGFERGEAERLFPA